MRLGTLATCLFLCPLAAHAAGVVIDLLPAEYCGPDDWNSQVAPHFKQSDGYAGPTCVLSYVATDPSVESEFEEKARISVNGKVYVVERVAAGTSPAAKDVGDQERREFMGLGGKLRVVLKATLAETTCKPDVESCCGDSYEGTLEVTLGDERAAISVSYYRGG